MSALSAAAFVGAAGSLLIAASVASTQPVPSRMVRSPHVSVEILASTARLTHGQHSFGLRFALEPGWHIYWQNPGDSGSPPDAHWQLPAGVNASPLEWPLPERVAAAGLVNYGYRGEVVLPVTLTVGANAATPASAGIGASVQWLVCKDVCVAGTAALSLSLPLQAPDMAQLPAWRQAIAAAKQKVPGRAPSSWKATARASRDSFLVDVVTGQREERGEYFPWAVSQIDDSEKPVVTPLASGVRFTLRKSEQLVKDPPALRAVVALAGGRSFVIEAPLAK